MEKIYLNRREAAAYVKAQGLPCAPSTLGKLACIGGGPEYRTFGRRVVYTTSDLDAWISARLSQPRSHTSALGPA